jgi:hypothetical protein
VFLVDKAGFDSVLGVPKKRLVIDLRPLNIHCQDFKAKYETLAQLGTLISEGETCAFLSFDLADAYNCLQILPEHQMYFGFRIQGRAYVMGALPFGWNQSPYAFGTAMKVLVRLLRSPDLPSVAQQQDSEKEMGAALRGLGSPVALRGASTVVVGGRRIGIWAVRTAEEVGLFPWHVIPYCDDFLIIVQGGTEELRRARSEEAKKVVLAAVERLGLTRHPDKGQWEPLSWIHHLGLKIDTTAGDGRILVTPQRVGKIRSRAKTLKGRALRHRRLVPARELAAFVGLVQSCYLAISVAQLFCRELNDCLKTKTSWAGNVRLSRQAIRDLEWWGTMPMKWNGREISRGAITQLLYTDASDFAWGAQLYQGKLSEVNAEQPGRFAGPEAKGPLTAAEQADGIMANEMRAAIWAIEAFLPQLRLQHVRMMQDNQAVMYCVRKLSSKQPVVQRLLRRFWALCDLHSIRITIDYVRSEFNEADRPSREVSVDEWGLDPDVFRMVEHELAVKHTIDLFASRVHHLTPRYVSEHPDGGALATDAFALKQWAPEVAWVNAPWDVLPRIAQRLESEPLASATVLCPYQPGSMVFNRLRRLASQVLVLEFDQRWVLRPPRQSTERVGPAVWSVAFVHVSPR